MVNYYVTATCSDGSPCLWHCKTVNGLNVPMDYQTAQSLATDIAAGSNDYTDICVIQASDYSPDCPD